MADDQLTPQQKYDEALAKLTAKQRRFVEEFLICMNASEAARRADYKDPGQAGYENKKKQEVAAAISAGFATQVMPPSEALARLADMARGTADDFVTVYESPLHDVTGQPITDKEGQPIVRYFPSLDIEKARRRGVLHLIKKVAYTAHGPSVELYDAQAALALIGKHHGLFVEKIDVSRQEIEAFLDRLKHNLPPEEYARIVALAAGETTTGE
jgi:phage terminase small subunit